MRSRSPAKRVRARCPPKASPQKSSKPRVSPRGAGGWMLLTVISVAALVRPALLPPLHPDARNICRAADSCHSPLPASSPSPALSPRCTKPLQYSQLRVAGVLGSSGDAGAGERHSLLAGLGGAKGERAKME